MAHRTPVAAVSKCLIQRFSPPAWPQHRLYQDEFFTYVCTYSFGQQLIGDVAWIYTLLCPLGTGVSSQTEASPDRDRHTAVQTAHLAIAISHRRE
jgi:hypothetical protein